jgi:type III restriction enzyme
MPDNTDHQRFRNADLVLKVTPNINPAVWDESRYEAFLDALCPGREYQKEAIRVALRYLLGGEYETLKDLARANFDDNATLQARYGSWPGMERHLQIPDKLSASLDLATGTGKSFVLYGIAAILLAEGHVDRVLVLCPSTTIEAGLLEKFRELAGNSDLRDALPAGAKISTPHIINASESITEGSICVENYHAILEHVGSSIRESLWGKGARTAVLNDEAHHVANDSATATRRWKEFLLDPGYDFRYIIGVSGTCYVKDEYFADVIYRYSLLQAMEERYVKQVRYVAEMPQTSDPDHKWQLIYSGHQENKRRLASQKLLPLTIIVTSRIARCNEVAEELKAFLIEKEKLSGETADKKVLVVYNNAPDVPKLRHVDRPTSKVEWIVSVSMLNEGWDVKRVFQIVPHEERAFNSKLLIAQVLGRGLRVPLDWNGAPPQVTVLNHDAWATRIRQLVNEILDYEKRLSSRVIDGSPFHFTLHNIDYTLQETSVTTPMTGGYKFFEKGYIEIAADIEEEEVSIEFERADSNKRETWRTNVQHKTFTPREIALHMHRRLEEEQDPEDPDVKMRTFYTDQFPVERLEEIITESLKRRGMTVATDSVRQKFLSALGTLRRKTSESVRYSLKANHLVEIPTSDRQADSVSAPELRKDKLYYFTTNTRANLLEDQLEFFDEATEPGSGFRCVLVANVHNFKTPLCAVIADHDPERRFYNALLEAQNLSHYDAFLKSTTIRFYEIDYAWKKGEHPKRGKFSPDFFIKVQNTILVVEIKGNEELADPSEENRKKNEYAVAHFKRLNDELEKAGNPIRYKFNFLTPASFSAYFKYLRDGHIMDYLSTLDIKLAEDEN